MYRSWWDPLLLPHSVLWLVYTEPGPGHTSGRSGNQCSCMWRNRLYKDLKRKVMSLCLVFFIHKIHVFFRRLLSKVTKTFRHMIYIHLQLSLYTCDLTFYCYLFYVFCVQILNLFYISCNFRAIDGMQTYF